MISVTIVINYSILWQGVFLVYDITLYRTFNLLSTWFNILSEVRYVMNRQTSSCLQASLEGIDVVLVGNKVDLESQRTVPLDLAKRVSNLYSLCSPLTNSLQCIFICNIFFQWQSS